MQGPRRPERNGESERRPAGRRAGVQGLQRGAGRPASAGRAQPGSRADLGLLEGAGRPRLGPAGRRCVLPGRPPEAGLGPTSEADSARCSRSRWPRESPAPACPEPRRVTKEAAGARAAWKRARPLWRPGAGCPAAIAPRGAQTPRRRPLHKPSGRRGRSGPVPGAAGRVSARRASSRPGFEESEGSGEWGASSPRAGGQALAAGTRAHAPRPPKGRLRDTDWRPPGTTKSCPGPFLPRGIRPLLIKTNKTKTGSRAQGCRRAASSPRSGVTLPFL